MKPGEKRKPAVRLIWGVMKEDGWSSKIEGY